MLPHEEPENFHEKPYRTKRDFPPEYRDALPPPERVVTIGIGFKCSDGILLATDTQYTRGGIKSHGPKLFDLVEPVKHPDVSVLVAGAGSVPFMKLAIDKIEERLAKTADPSLDDVKVLVEDVLVRVFTDHIYPIPEYKQSQDFELMLGVWTKRDGYGLFTTALTAVTQVAKEGTGYCCIGSGIPLSEYALELSYQDGLNVENAKFLAIFCIKAAKDHVGSCGGATKIHTLTNDGMRDRVMRGNVAALEQYSEDLFNALKYVFKCLDFDNVYHEAMTFQAIEALRHSIFNFKVSQEKRKENVRAVVDGLRSLISNPPKPPAP